MDDAKDAKAAALSPSPSPDPKKEAMMEVSNFDVGIDKAAKLLALDPNGLFFYKYPKFVSQKKKIFCNISSAASLETEDTEYNVVQAEEIMWPSILNFEFDTVVQLIRDFVGKWRLSPEINFSINPRNKGKGLTVPGMGMRYFVDVWFFIPSEFYTNPLTVTKAKFFIHVPFHLPLHYPVNVTYSLDGYKTIYYTMGEKYIRSFDFQNFLIESVLKSRLAALIEKNDSPLTVYEEDTAASFVQCESKSFEAESSVREHEACKPDNQLDEKHVNE